MAEAEEEVKPTPESKQTLLRRIMLVMMLQYLAAFVLAAVVVHTPVLLSTLQHWYWELILCFLLSEAVMIAVYFLDFHIFRGIVGYIVLVLFSLLFVAIFGGLLPAMLPSFLLGQGMLLVISIGGFTYLLAFYPQEQLGTQLIPGDFKAHVVVPGGLLLSLVLYGSLLTFFHTETTFELMMWTFIEGGFTIYFSLVLEDIHRDPFLGQEDWCVGAIKIYSESLFVIISAFQTKSIAKGK
jgi:hypothetical protein